jgi:hypothetical protein
MAYPIDSSFVKKMAKQETPKSGASTGSYLPAALKGLGFNASMGIGRLAGAAEMFAPQHAGKISQMGQNVSEEALGSPSGGYGVGEGIGQMSVTPTAPLVSQLAAEGIKKGADYMQPGKKAAEIESSLGQGTAEENINELSKILQESRKSQTKGALEPKKSLFKKIGGKNLEVRTPQEKPDLEEISRLLGQSPEEAGAKKLEELSKSVKDYYKHGDIDKFIEKAEGIYSPKELSPKEEAKLESMLPEGKLEKSKYLKLDQATEYYGDALKEAHEAYKKNPSAKNAYKLIKDLNGERGSLIREQKKRRLLPDERRELDSLSKSHAAVKADLEGYIKTLPKEEQGKYEEFNKAWSEQVEPYNSSKRLRNMSLGNTKNLTPAKVTGEFSFSSQSPEMQTILGHIGEKGKNKVLYNFIKQKNPQTAFEFGSAILEAKNDKGLGQFVSPEMEKAAIKLRRQYAISKILSSGAGLLAGESLGGHLGGAAGIAIPLWKEIAKTGGNILKYIK